LNRFKAALTLYLLLFALIYPFAWLFDEVKEAFAR